MGLQSQGFDKDLERVGLPVKDSNVNNFAIDFYIKTCVEDLSHAVGISKQEAGECVLLQKYRVVGDGSHGYFLAGPQPFLEPGQWPHWFSTGFVILQVFLGTRKAFLELGQTPTRISISLI